MESPMRASATKAFFVVLCWTAATAPVQGEDVGSFDPKAVEVIRAMSGFLQGLDSFRVTMQVTVQTQEEEASESRLAEYPIAMQRPNMFSMIVADDVKGITVVCDGTHLHLYWPALQEYTLQGAPRDMDVIVASGEVAAYGMEEFRTSLLRSMTSTEPYTDLMRAVMKVAYVGIDDVDGTMCHRLRFSGKVKDWDLWVNAKGDPVPKRFVPDYQAMMLKTMGEPGTTVKEEVTFSGWEVNVAMPPGHFTFSRPAAAKKVSNFFQDMLEEEETLSALLGDAAPGFTLDLLGGGRVELAKQEGSVVALVFWSRLFPRSDDALEVAAELAASYANRGVIFYGINEGDERTKALRAVNGLTGDIAVALDEDKKVGELYEAITLPQIVLIGGDGTVRGIRLGWRSNLGELLKKDLDSLLSEMGGQLGGTTESEMIH